MTRFTVTRQYVKYKGHLYKKGELLPPEFTERDRCRNIYPSRIGTVNVPEAQPTQATAPVTQVVPKKAAAQAAYAKGVVNAAKPKATVTISTTGANVGLSGQAKVVSK